VEYKIESWIDDRKVENEDFKITEYSNGKEFIFYLPWYACFELEPNDLFLGLDEIGCCDTRSSTMLEF